MSFQPRISGSPPPPAPPLPQETAPRYTPPRQNPSDTDQIDTPCCCNPIAQFFSFLYGQLLRFFQFLGCCRSEAPSSTEEPPPQNLFQNNIPEGALIPEQLYPVLTQSTKNGTPEPFPNATNPSETLFSRFKYDERPVPVYPEGILEKYSKNAGKAFTEHDASEPDVYYYPGPVTLETLGGSLTTLHSSRKWDSERSLEFAGATAPGYGKKPSEDAHLFKGMDQGITLAAVFDGHGGTWVSQFAAAHFYPIFSEQLVCCGYIVPLALERSLELLQECLCMEVEMGRRPKDGGSTGLICCVDPVNNLVYTATLGDSEANIYRRIEGRGVVSIPLSCVRNWTSKKDEARAQAFFQKFYPESVQIGTLLFGEGNDSVKERRIPGRSDLECFRLGPNVSRALGDVLFTQIVDGQSIGIAQKPKITVQAFKPGDRLVLACDGLKDFVKEKAIVDKVSELSSARPGDLATALVQSSLDNQSHGKGDNVTVLVIDL